MSESKDIRPKVVLIVQNHSITGELRLGDVRLSDLLNDVRHSFVELDNATLSHFSEAGKLIHRTRRTVIPKDKVVLAFELDAEQVANTKRIFHYRNKRKYPVFLATKDVEIRGFLHTPPSEARPDLSLIQDRRFVPLTKATVTFCTVENCDFTRDAILVNVHDIQYFAVGDAVHADK